jgi:hypothetical protein
MNNESDKGIIMLLALFFFVIILLLGIIIGMSEEQGKLQDRIDQLED